MKSLTTLTCAVAAVGALAFAGANAMASSLNLNISGAVLVQGTNGMYKGTTETHSVNEKDVYGIITNALASASIPGIAPATLPANGYIAFDPGDSDGLVNGFFYVTNKTGFYLPLSGDDTNGNYYSFAELDTVITVGNTNGVETNNWGFYYYVYNDNDGGSPSPLFESIASYNLNKTGTGSDKSTSKAVLYIHDDPNAYGNPPTDLNKYYNSLAYPWYPFFYNQNAIEINGILTATLGVKTNNVATGSLSLPGTGNFEYLGTYSGVVTSGRATLTLVK